jgi:hypothetical protein
VVLPAQAVPVMVLGLWSIAGEPGHALAAEPGVSGVADLPGLVRIVKRKLKKIQYRPQESKLCI